MGLDEPIVKYPATPAVPVRYPATAGLSEMNRSCFWSLYDAHTEEASRILLICQGAKEFTGILMLKKGTKENTSKRIRSKSRLHIVVEVVVVEVVVEVVVVVVVVLINS